MKKIFYCFVLCFLLVSNVHAQAWQDWALNNNPSSAATFLFLNPATNELNRIYWSSMQALLGGEGGTGGNYLYIGYASDDSGTDFTTTFSESLDYMAFLVSAVEIDPLVVGHFTGLWKRVVGAAASEHTRTMTAAAANNFAAGDVGYVSSSGVVLADASAEASVKGLLVMATETVTGGNTGDFALTGEVTVTSHGFTLGAPLFVDDTTPGGLVESGIAAESFARIAAYGIDANTIFFNPSAVWVEVPAE